MYILSHVFAEPPVGTYIDPMDKALQLVQAKYNRTTCKLEIQQDQHMLSKQTIKRMKRYNWNCKQKILQLMQQEFPNIYRVKLRRERINFRRIRPYVYLMVQAAFCLEIRTPLLETLSETLIALVQLIHTVPKEVEDRLKVWGLTELKSRQFVIHLWNVLVEASYQIQGIPSCIETLEARVKMRESEVYDYAYACYLALPFSKYYEDLQNLKRAKKSKAGRSLPSCFTTSSTSRKKHGSKETERRCMIERLVTYQEISDKRE